MSNEGAEGMEVETVETNTNVDEIVHGDLTRKAIDSHEQRKNEGKSKLSFKDNLYPKLSGNYQTVDHPMDMNEDTHSVLNGEDGEVGNDHSQSNQQCSGVFMHEQSYANEREINKRKRSSPTKEKTPPPKQTLNPAKRNFNSHLNKKDYYHEERVKTPMHDVKPKSLFTCNLIIVILAIMTVILAMTVFYGVWDQYLPQIGNLPVKNPDFDSIISNLSNSFDGQPKMSFKIVKSALKAVSASEPQAPAIILLLASKGAEKLALNLGNALVSSVSASPIEISGKYYQTQGINIGKKSLDDTLRVMDATADSQFNAVLVQDLHLIPGETALMLHTYCDSENAPYKHVVYVLIVNMEEEVAKGQMKDWDIAVNKRLDIAWKDVDEDQRAPLLSRLTVSVAGIFV